MRTAHVGEPAPLAIPRALARVASLAAALVVLPCGPCAAGSPDSWDTGFGLVQLGALIGIAPWASDDGPTTGEPLPIGPASRGVFALLYREQGAHWMLPTGFYGEDFRRTPVPPGGSKTWWDFYLWAQNWTLDPPGQVQVRTNYEDATDRPPDGYVGQLVLDYVPPECNWTGPTEFWLDLTRNNNLITLPAITVTDPLQGTRFHLTVYAPIPEPSGLLALGACLAALVAAAVKRRR